MFAEKQVALKKLSPSENSAPLILSPAPSQLLKSRPKAIFFSAPPFVRAGLHSMPDLKKVQYNIITYSIILLYISCIKNSKTNSMSGKKMK